MNVLALLVLTPLVGGILLSTLPRGRDGAVRAMTLGWTLVTFALALWAAYKFDWTEPTGHMQLTATLPWIDSFGLRFAFGIDAISMWLMLLTAFLMPLTVMGAFSAVQQRAREFYFWLLALEAAMLGTFLATDLIFFYICFEFTLIPLYFLIGIYGSSQRLRAARVFFLYTFTGSMLTFAGVLYVAWHNASQTGVWTFGIAQLYEAARSLPLTQQRWLLLALLAGFAVKVPLWPFHTWLPLAHTEAPTAGSVILAGVLLKLGTYGLLRFALPMTMYGPGGTPGALIEMAPYLASLAIVGILYTALICWVQRDLKKLIAYSSVSHLGFCVLGLLALNAVGVSGSLLYMVNHGLSTGALFLCVGMIYERFHTREMAEMNGLSRAMPVWAFFMVFFALASVGLPGLNGFVSEFLTILGAFTSTLTLGPWFGAVAAIGMVLGAIYIFYMLGKVVFGPLKVPDDHAHGTGPIRDLNFREILTLTPLAMACLALGLYPMPLLNSLEAPIARLTAPAPVSLYLPGPEVTTVIPVEIRLPDGAGASDGLELSR